MPRSITERPLPNDALRQADPSRAERPWSDPKREPQERVATCSRT